MSIFGMDGILVQFLIIALNLLLLLLSYEAVVQTPEQRRTMKELAITE